LIHILLDKFLNIGRIISKRRVFLGILLSKSNVCTPCSGLHTWPHSNPWTYQIERTTLKCTILQGKNVFSM